MSGSAIQTTLLAVVLLGMQTGVSAADKLSAKLTGYEAVPALYSPGSGRFTATTTSNTITFKITYTGIASAVTQVHIHVGQTSVIGGISAFICSNLGNGPAGTPACPNSGAVSGTITAAKV